MPGKKRVWILLADATRARVFTCGGEDEGIRAVEDGEIENTELHRHTRDAGSDRPGRSYESVGGARHAQEPRVDLHRQEKERFARKIADYLASNAQSNRFDELILVAPPQFLGELRDGLDKQTASRVIREVAKDLMKLPAPKLAAQLRSLVRPERERRPRS